MRGRGMLDGGLPNYSVYATADQRHIAVGALEKHFWVDFCTGLGRADLIDCTQHAPVEELFRSKTFDEWKEILARLDSCIEPVLVGPQELTSHPQHVARNTFLPGDSKVGSHTQVVMGPRLSEHTPGRLTVAPRLHQHTRQVLLASGFTENEIEQFQKDGAIVCE